MSVGDLVGTAVAVAAYMVGFWLLVRCGVREDGEPKPW